MAPYLRAANVKDGALDLSDVKEMNFDPEEQVIFALRPGDVLVTEGSGSINAVGASSVWNGELGGTVCFQNTLLRLRPRAGTDPRFLAWWCRHAFADGLFASAATGANIYHLSAERARSLPMMLMSLAEQRAIADYLDAETARIDALIAKKQQLIHLLGERWGRCLRLELRSIGQQVPLKRGWTVTDCKHRTPSYQLTGYPVVSPGDTTPGRLDLTRCHRFVGDGDFADLTGGGRRAQRGDIIYSRNASIGIASLVDADLPFCMGQDVCLITSRFNEGLFLMYVLNSLGVDQLEELKLGSTFSRVNISQILELQVPLAAPDEQRRLAEHIDERKRLYDLAIESIGRQIELLAEHRQALITAAVSGERAAARDT